MPGAKGSGRGGGGRAEIPVAPAGKHLQAWGARTRGAHGCGSARATAPPSCSALAAACRRWRNCGRGAGPAPQPGTQQTGQGRGRGRGPAPAGALRERLFSRVQASCPLRCGKLGGFVRGWLGMRAGEAWGEDEKPGTGGWESLGLPGNCTPSRAPETGGEGRRVPRGWTPRCEQRWGRGSPSCALPKASTRMRCGHTSPRPLVLVGLVRGARGGGKAAVGVEGRCAAEVWPLGRGRKAPPGFGPAAAAAQRGGARAARCPPSALRSLPALTFPRNERKRKSVHLKGQGRLHPAARRVGPRARGRARQRQVS